MLRLFLLLFALVVAVSCRNEPADSYLLACDVGTGVAAHAASGRPFRGIAPRRLVMVPEGAGQPQHRRFVPPYAPGPKTPESRGIRQSYVGLAATGGHSPSGEGCVTFSRSAGPSPRISARGVDSPHGPAYTPCAIQS